MITTSGKPSEPADAPVPGVYRHYKGSLYQVMGMARHSETEEWLVVYRALYGEQGFWLRPLSLWLEPVANRAATEGRDDNGASERFSLLEANDLSLQSIMKTG